jgi:hypothetical protein
VFSVEIRIHDGDEKAVTAKMNSMREWLDHQRFEPSTFRYTFAPPGLLFQIDFKLEAEAMLFARTFGGRVLVVSETEEAAD